MSATLVFMIVKAHVREGRLIVDEPTDLPDGTEVDLLPLDPGDWLDETGRAALHEALRQSDADVAAGRLIDADEILKELRLPKCPSPVCVGGICLKSAATSIILSMKTP